MKTKLIQIGLMLMFITGLMLVLINPIQSFLVSHLSKSLVPTPTQQVAAENSEVSFDFEAVQSLSIIDVLRAQASKSDLPVIGSIAIPEVGLELPILKGVGKEALAAGAGTMKPQQMMGQGNYSLASHYFEEKDILFGPLYEAEIGDKIYLSDLSYVYEYELTTKDIIEETDVYIIDDVPNETLLTLITCAVEGSKRLAVRATFTQRYTPEYDANEAI
ncbi:class A sortase [Lysinibacillus sp. KU-BSD001]|uniref:class A sortase n=1 Tax=Lysinibacillus sp. KU-BSD001 TaxID=3141328 RepID=UPI0036DFF548